MVTAGADGSWKTLRYALVGECVLDQYTGKLKITSTRLDGIGLMNINLIELAPQGSWAELQAQIIEAATASGKTPKGTKRRPFDKLEGARWIDKADRKSGEIIVKHGDKEHTFRPYFVKLPPANEPTSRFAKADLKRSADSLKTTEAKILRFGKKVDEALRDAVWTKDLTIYTRWENRGRPGSYYAYILVDDKPLSLDLIRNGEARLSGAFATAAPFAGDDRHSGKIYLNRLKTAEKDARNNRRGMWGL